MHRHASGHFWSVVLAKVSLASEAVVMVVRSNVAFRHVADIGKLAAVLPNQPVSAAGHPHPQDVSHKQIRNCFKRLAMTSAYSACPQAAQ